MRKTDFFQRHSLSININQETMTIIVQMRKHIEEEIINADFEFVMEWSEIQNSLNAMQLLYFLKRIQNAKLTKII